LAGEKQGVMAVADGGIHNPVPLAEQSRKESLLAADQGFALTPWHCSSTA
jgi:hypothetical protein